MGKKLILGGVLGGLVYFVWGFIAWTLIPWHHATLRTFIDGEAVVSAINANTQGRGVYLYPSESEDQAALEAKMARGPFLFVSVDDRGMASMTRPLVTAILIQILCALLVTWLLLQTSGLAYGRRVTFVTVLGLVAGLLCFLPSWNWFGFSTGYTVVSILDLTIGSLLAGLAIAWAAK
jgi:hypothetical protein